MTRPWGGATRAEIMAEVHGMAARLRITARRRRLAWFATVSRGALVAAMPYPEPYVTPLLIGTTSSSSETVYYHREKGRLVGHSRGSNL
jgi:hypothetical protein